MKSILKAVDFFFKKPSRALYVLLVDASYVGLVWLLVWLMASVKPMIVQMSGAGQRIAAVVALVLYGLGHLVLLGVFAVMAMDIIAGKKSKGVTFRRIHAMWVLQSWVGVILTVSMLLVYSAFAAVLPVVGDKVLAVVLTLLLGYLGLAALVAGETIIITRNVNPWRVFLEIPPVFTKWWKKGAVLFLAFLGVLTVVAMLLAGIGFLLRGIVSAGTWNIIYGVVATLSVYVCRVIAKRVVVEWLTL